MPEVEAEYVVEVYAPHYRAAFTLDEAGQLIETIDFIEDPLTREVVPEWRNGGVCDEVRGENPNLQKHILATINSLKG